MSKSEEPEAPKPEAPIPKHCWNCSQPVSGAVANDAGNIEVVFCCECGLQLSREGTCINTACRFHGEPPRC